MRDTLFVLFILAGLGSAASAAYTGAAIVDSSGVPTPAYYDVISSSYMDFVGPNPDLTLRVYSDRSGELTGKWVTFVYRVGDKYLIISDGSAPNTYMERLGPEHAGAQYYAVAPINLNFLSDWALYPGILYAVVSDDSVVSSGDSFVYIPQQNGWLRGSYVTNNVERTYDEASDDVTVMVSRIWGDSASGPFQITKSARYLIIGVCADERGENCSGSEITDSDTPVILFANSTMKPIWKYYVINGIATSFCIGPNLMLQSLSASPPNPEPGAVVTITAMVRNDGNVKISTPFNVTFYDGEPGLGRLIGTRTISSLNPHSNAQVNVPWNTAGQSGAHTLYAIVDEVNVVQECSETDNIGTASVVFAMNYFINVYIDGNLSTHFPRAEKPYNVTIEILDSNRRTVPGAHIRIIERNGINLFTPLQAWEERGERKGLVVYSIGEAVTNAYGNVTVAVVPTSKALFAQYPALPDYVGEYQAYVELVSPSYATKELTLGDEPTEASERVNVINQDFVETVMDLGYKVYSISKAWLTFLG